MCMTWLQPPGIMPALNSVRNSWEDNPHGAGFMFCKDGELCIEKPFFRLKDFIRAYDDAWSKYGQSSPFVCHFRLATHGSKREINIHPHPLADGRVGLAHNGILSNFEPPIGYDISDTVWFCETVLAARHEDQLMDKRFGKWLDLLIGKWNKFILLCADGRSLIVGDDRGRWDNGVWYSNDGYKAAPSYCDINLFTEHESQGYTKEELIQEGCTEDEAERWLDELNAMDNQFVMKVG